MVDVLKYTRADLASLIYHPIRPLDVVSEEIGIPADQVAFFIILIQENSTCFASQRISAGSPVLRDLIHLTAAAKYCTC